MKTFKEYLTESKKTYEFKVKIAGDCPKDCSKQLKLALSEFHLSSCSAGRSTPIQETLIDFPEHKNCAMTIFDITTDYPATSLQIRDKVAAGLGLALANVKVRNLKEEEEIQINHAHDEKSGKALIGTEYEPSNHQNLVGEEHKMSFLKDLEKQKHQGTQYKGINDEILAEKEPAEKTAKVKTIDKKTGSVSPVGTKQNKIPDPIKGL
jgi:hypothetical protein